MSTQILSQLDLGGLFNCTGWKGIVSAELFLLVGLGISVLMHRRLFPRTQEPIWDRENGLYLIKFFLVPGLVEELIWGPLWLRCFGPGNTSMVSCVIARVVAHVIIAIPMERTVKNVFMNWNFLMVVANMGVTNIMIQKASPWWGFLIAWLTHTAVVQVWYLRFGGRPVIRSLNGSFTDFFRFVADEISARCGCQGPGGDQGQGPGGDQEPAGEEAV